MWLGLQQLDDKPFQYDSRKKKHHRNREYFSPGKIRAVNNFPPPQCVEGQAPRWGWPPPPAGLRGGMPAAQLPPVLERPQVRCGPVPRLQGPPTQSTSTLICYHNPPPHSQSPHSACSRWFHSVFCFSGIEPHLWRFIRACVAGSGGRYFSNSFVANFALKMVSFCARTWLLQNVPMSAPDQFQSLDLATFSTGLNGGPPHVPPVMHCQRSNYKAGPELRSGEINLIQMGKHLENRRKWFPAGDSPRRAAATFPLKFEFSKLWSRMQHDFLNLKNPDRISGA